ncbi:hypothetical protein LTR86_008908 [Recurvomyces mirabilis]|nr:hypothetical protein LTR86_008908 [Recurvomyces mirabilis]
MSQGSITAQSADGDLNTGTTHCNYDVDFSGVDFSPSGLGLDGVTIGASVTRYLTVSTKIVPGVKDTVFSHSIADCYPLQLRQAATLRVVLYDARERRGWLVDGTECLLYLSRSFFSGPLTYGNSSQELVDSFKHRDKAKKDLDSAFKVLMHPGNRLIEVFGNFHRPDEADQDSEDHRLSFPKLVSHFYELLWQIKGHFEMLKKAQRWTLGTGGNCLDGFDFTELVSLETTLHPRSLKLGASGKQWLPLTSHMGAINLFGTDYGQLIKASDACADCTQLPSGVDLLATSVTLLQSKAKSIRDYAHQRLFSSNSTAAVILGCTAEMKKATWACEIREQHTNFAGGQLKVIAPVASTEFDHGSLPTTLLTTSTTEPSSRSTMATSVELSTMSRSTSTFSNECVLSNRQRSFEKSPSPDMPHLEIDLRHLSIRQLHAELARRLQSDNLDTGPYHGKRYRGQQSDTGSSPDRPHKVAKLAPSSSPLMRKREGTSDLRADYARNYG